MYQGPVKEGAWSEFYPEVINYSLSDPNKIQRVLDSITEPEWQALDSLLPQIPQLNEGLYRMWGSHMGRPIPEPWLRRNAGIIFAGIGGLVVIRIIMGFAFKPANHEGLASVTLPPPPPPIARNAAPAPLPPVEPPVEVPTPAPVTLSAKPVSQFVPAPPDSVDLGGRVVSFTNLQRKVYQNVTLVRAEPRGLVYTSGSGGGMVPLALVPLPVLAELGVPTNWPSVMQGRPGEPGQPTPPARKAGQLYTVGDKVDVYWGGKWQRATVKEARPPVYNVGIDGSPMFQNLSVFTNWLRSPR
jgi:hypothetical protein